MKTRTLLRIACLIMLMLTVGLGYGQDLGGIVKKKVKKRAKDNVEKTVDDGLDAIEGKDKGKEKKKKDSSEEPNDEVKVVEVEGTTDNTARKTAPLADFIYPATAIFVDDFNLEKPTEFPSKWTQLDGTFQNAQVVRMNDKDGVVELFTTNGLMKPTIEGDRYLGREFQVEMEVYFYDKGNEQYIIELKNQDNGYLDHEIRIGNGVMWNGSEAIARLPRGVWAPGWHTVQISFNSGNLKAYLDGFMLVNDPDITSNKKFIKDHYTHLELGVLSPGSNANPRRPAAVSYFAVGGQGHDLYKKLKTDGKLVMNDINFEVNSFVISTDSYGILDDMATMLNDHSDINLSINGHTDSDGTNSFNQTLSENRAKAVMSYLISKGVSATRLKSVGYGEEKPVDTSGSETAKAKNRRVEFVLM